MFIFLFDIAYAKRKTNQKEKHRMCLLSQTRHVRGHPRTPVLKKQKIFIIKPRYSVSEVLLYVIDFMILSWIIASHFAVSDFTSLSSAMQKAPSAFPRFTRSAYAKSATSFRPA